MNSHPDAGCYGAPQAFGFPNPGWEGDPDTNRKGDQEARIACWPAATVPWYAIAMSSTTAHIHWLLFQGPPLQFQSNPASSTPAAVLIHLWWVPCVLLSCTTLFIRNIPYTFPYDYLNIPPDKRKGRNRGIAFVNFTTAEAAQAFKKAFQGRLLAPEKPVEVREAYLQGLEANARLHPSAAAHTTSAGA